MREEQRRLQELKDQLDLQAVKDRDRYKAFYSNQLYYCDVLYRVKLREEKLLQKLEEKRVLQNKLKEEEKERERRLDRLREKVQT